MSKIAVVQRICTHYRIPVFQKIAVCKSVDLTVLFGSESPKDVVLRKEYSQNIKYKKMFSIPIRIKYKSKTYFVPIFPALIYYFIINNFDVVITEGTSNLINNLFIFIMCKIKKTKFIWWDSGKIMNGTASNLRKLIEPLVSFFIRRSDACIGYSSVSKKYFLSKGMDSEKIFIAQNTIDTNKMKKDIARFKPLVKNEKKLRGWGKKKIILYVGTLERRKKVENLVFAYKNIKRVIPESALLLIGDGPNKDSLVQLCNNLQVEDVYFLGSIYDDIILYYLLSDIFVLPGEGGLSVNLAMACGKPVVTTAADGTVEDLIIDGVNGYVVSGDIADITHKIKNILLSAKLRKQFGRLSQLKIFTEINIDNMVDNIMKAIKSV